MAVTYDLPRRRALHPINAILLAATIPLFLGALLSDLAYRKSFEIQWTNFASWLIAGGLVFGALAVIAAAVALFRAERRGGLVLVYFLLVLATWIVGFVNAVVHGKDAWATMPDGLILSLVAVVLACIAKWIAFSGLRTGVTP